MTNEIKQKNTTELLKYFKDMRARAAKEQNELDRKISMESERNAEWYTLFSCLFVPSMREIYDTVRIAERLDEMRAELGDTRKNVFAKNGDIVHVWE